MHSNRSHSRLLAIVLALLIPAAANAAPVTVTSPDGKIAIVIDVDVKGQLVWRATMNGSPLIDTSQLGIVVDGTNLGAGADVQKSAPYKIDEKYPWNGVHSMAINRANGARITVKHRATATAFVVDARAADAAVAFRIIVEGSGRRVPDAAATFTLPAGSVIWSHGLRDHYEALYERRKIEDVPEGDWAAPPITIKLPGSSGFAAISEADLRNYAGMALQADGHGAFREKLAHDHPPGYPYTLRYGDENARRLSVAAPIEGTITTPWRVVIAGRDLNTLVNSDAIHNL